MAHMHIHTLDLEHSYRLVGGGGNYLIFLTERQTDFAVDTRSGRHTLNPNTLNP